MTKTTKFVRYSFPDCGITPSTAAENLKIGRIYEVKNRSGITGMTVLVLSDFPELGFDVLHFEDINIDEKLLKAEV